MNTLVLAIAAAQTMMFVLVLAHYLSVGRDFDKVRGIDELTLSIVTQSQSFMQTHLGIHGWRFQPDSCAECKTHLLQRAEQALAKVAHKNLQDPILITNDEAVGIYMIWGVGKDREKYGVWRVDLGQIGTQFDSPWGRVVVVAPDKEGTWVVSFAAAGKRPERNRYDR